jgi:hypothetical protein
MAVIGFLSGVVEEYVLLGHNVNGCFVPHVSRQHSGLIFKGQNIEEECSLLLQS